MVRFITFGEIAIESLETLGVNVADN